MNQVENNKREDNPLVFTIPERCRTCYTCVRECPAKAIRIESGQAEVINNRCIGCGNCVKVCSQDAKVYRSSATRLLELLRYDSNVAAIVAPSFPAEFMELPNHMTFVGMVRQLGFKYVNEVAFGADMVALKYKELILEDKDKYISSDCPAIVSYIERYHPHLTDKLVPIVSPMVASARILREKHGKDIKIAFIGPCIAKKDESPEIDIAITFSELREIFALTNTVPGKAVESRFDEPRGGKGAVFPISRGLAETMEINNSLYDGNLVVAEGRVDFPEAIREFDQGKLKNEHLELLCCEGCIMGAGMSNHGNRFAKRTFVAKYVKEKLNHLDTEQWKKSVDEFNKLDYSQKFVRDDQRINNPKEADVFKVLQQLGKFTAKDHLNCGACGYESCREHAIAIIQGLAEDEMCLPYAIEKLHNSVQDLAVSNKKLASVQQALKQSEKLAHMGQLSAGIAHELNNPLGVVIMYANILLDECEPDNPVREDLELIVKQTDRCKNIVGGLLNFARKNQVKYEEVNVGELAENAAAGVVVPKNVRLTYRQNVNECTALLDREQMTQVLTNLLKNGIEAMPNGGSISLNVSETNSDVVFEVVDTGQGIPKEHMDKLFTPFFTTKGIGKGTGLGLATVYGIVKMHKGKINVDSNTDIKQGSTGTTFKISIPKIDSNERE